MLEGCLFGQVDQFVVFLLKKNMEHEYLFIFKHELIKCKFCACGIDGTAQMRKHSRCLILPRNTQIQCY